MKNLYTAVAALALFTAPALAGELGASGGGSLQGESSSLSVTGGAVLNGGGSFKNEAQNFSGAAGTLNGKIELEPNGMGGGLVISTTSETLSQGKGFNKQTGDAIGGALQLGGAISEGNYWANAWGNAGAPQSNIPQ